MSQLVKGFKRAGGVVLSDMADYTKYLEQKKQAKILKENTDMMKLLLEIQADIKEIKNKIG